MDIILANGAPFSGKDTLVRRLQAFFENGVYIRFKDPLYKRFAARHNLDMETVVRICNGEQKDHPHELIGGLIPRQELIDISENEIKVEKGEAGVAIEVIDNILDTEEHGRKTFLFPDSGFEPERTLFKKVLPRYGLDRLVTIRILRDGCDFAGKKDSRGYLSNPDLIIDNNVNEDHLPEEERGQHMFDQFMTWYKENY